MEENVENKNLFEEKKAVRRQVEERRPGLSVRSAARAIGSVCHLVTDRTTTVRFRIFFYRVSSRFPGLNGAARTTEFSNLDSRGRRSIGLFQFSVEEFAISGGNRQRHGSTVWPGSFEWISSLLVLIAFFYFDGELAR